MKLNFVSAFAISELNERINILIFIFLEIITFKADILSISVILDKKHE